METPGPHGPAQEHAWDNEDEDGDELEMEVEEMGEEEMLTAEMEGSGAVPSSRVAEANRMDADGYDQTAVEDGSEQPDLPPEWCREAVETSTGSTHLVYRGPNGEKVSSKAGAWRRFRKITSAPTRQSSRPSQPIKLFRPSYLGSAAEKERWEPPAAGEAISVEVEDAYTQGAPEWRAASVICGEANGGGQRFLVCVHKPDGQPDPDFLEWYDEQTEGHEWRRGGADHLPRLNTSQPPPGWSKDVRGTDRGQNYVYIAPNGERARSSLEAWRKQAEPATAHEDAALSAASADDAPVSELPPGWTKEYRDRHGSTKGAYFICRGPNGEQSRSLKAAWKMHENEEDGEAEDVAAPSEALCDKIKKELPPGWAREVRSTYRVYWGPDGERAATISAAWEMHAKDDSGTLAREDVPASAKRHSNAQELPLGWTRKKNRTPAGNQWTSFHGDGRSASTISQAWAIHARADGGDVNRSLSGELKRLAESTTVQPAAKQPRTSAEEASSNHPHAVGAATLAAAPSSKCMLASSAGIAADGMQDVARMLERFRLVAYVDKFDEEGYDDYEWILTMETAQVEKLIADVGMKPGHAAKLKQYLAMERQAAATAVA